jgi:pimeloyl-ACP methyl ester carboxylesterase
VFGILTSPPPEIQRPDLPGIIILNAGTVHRVGAHRLHVPLARRWAALGFHVLRLDLSGIGDSPAAPGCQENLSYPRDSRADVQAAMDFLTDKIKLRRFVLTGVCSGADVAFQVGYEEPRTAGVMLMNPRTFCVNDLKVINTYQQARWYQGSLLRTQSWLKLLRGDVDIARAVRIVAPKVKDVVVRRAKRAVGGLLGGALTGGGRGGEASARPASEADVPGCLRMMAERGVDTFLLVTENDPGVDYLEANYGSDMRLLASLPSFHRTDMRGTDNTFTARWSQEQVAQILTDHVKQRFLAAQAA